MNKLYTERLFVGGLSAVLGVLILCGSAFAQANDTESGILLRGRIRSGTATPYVQTVPDRTVIAQPSLSMGQLLPFANEIVSSPMGPLVLGPYGEMRGTLTGYSTYMKRQMPAQLQQQYGNLALWNGARITGSEGGTVVIGPFGEFRGRVGSIASSMPMQSRIDVGGLAFRPRTTRDLARLIRRSKNNARGTP